MQEPTRAHDPARRAAWTGFAAAVGSSVGQTFFIGLFGLHFQGAFDLDPAGLGALYAIATTAAGALMFWLGALADHQPLRRALAFAGVVLAAGAALMAIAHSAWVLLLGLFLLRLGGQGLLGHFAIVAATRYARRRGRSITIAAFGFLTAEAALPTVVVLALASMEWRMVWAMCAVAIMLGMFLVLLPLARPLPRIEHHPAEHAHATVGRWELLGNRRFLALLSVLLVSAFTVTAVFFHVAQLFAGRGWPVDRIAAGFVMFAAAQAIAVVSVGRLVDRFGAMRILRFYLLPLACGVLAVGLGGPVTGPLLMFAGLGMTAGAQSVMGGAVWAELYGTQQLGLVRGVFAACMVFATAASPMLLGFALTNGIALVAMAAGVALYAIVVPQFVAWIASRGGSRLLFSR